MSGYGVTLRQLDRDVSRAGFEYPEQELADVDRKTLRALIRKLIELAPRCEFPLAPEMRVKGETGAFLLKAVHGQLRFDSWSANTSVINPSVETILSTIEGEAVEEYEARPKRGAASAGKVQSVKLALLAAAIIIANGFSAWQLMAPKAVPTTLVPATTPLPDELANETLRRFAGKYATGAAQGDRVLIISHSGEIKWQTLATGGKVAEEQTLRCRPVESKGERGLMAENLGLIAPADSGASVVYFGDKYRRVTDAVIIK